MHACKFIFHCLTNLHWISPVDTTLGVNSCPSIICPFVIHDGAVVMRLDSVFLCGIMSIDLVVHHATSVAFMRSHIKHMLVRWAIDKAAKTKAKQYYRHVDSHWFVEQGERARPYADVGYMIRWSEGNNGVLARLSGSRYSFITHRGGVRIGIWRSNWTLGNLVAV